MEEAIKGGLSQELAERASNFLNVAKILFKIKNRYVGFWFVAYYNLFHSLELTIKSSFTKNSIKIPKSHDVIDIIKKSSNFLDFSVEEIESIEKLQDLNKGPGGLRYPNKFNGVFLPSIFKENVKIVEKILKSL